MNHKAGYLMKTLVLCAAMVTALAATAASADEYLGQLSSNPYATDSTANRFGQHGSPYSSDSINNPYGAGSPYRTDSPNNPYGEGLSIYGDEE